MLQPFTNLYYSVVNEMVISAYEQANGDRKKQTENVSLALNTVRVLLEIMNAMA